MKYFKDKSSANAKSKKLCLVCSHGGHFRELMQLESLFKNYNYFFITFESYTTKNLDKSYLFSYYGWDFKAKIYEIIIFIKTFFILKKEKPDVIITTGGGEIAVPVCLIGIIFGCKIIFIETLTRISSKSGAGKILYYFSDIFLVQWKSLKSIYGRKAKYWGKVI